MEAKQLRQKVLDLAIHGKLVPQIETEEPASVLLDRINKEKNRLYKNGLLKKKDLVITKIENEDIPFELPSTWEWVRFEDAFSQSSGKQLRAEDKEGTLREYITTSNLYWDRFELGNLKKMYFKDSELEKCTAIEGDLLLCEGGDVGRSAVWERKESILLQNHVHRLRPYCSISSRFFMFVMMYMKNHDMLNSRGVTIQGFSGGVVKKTIVPLPPLQEQYRIVSEIDKWMGLIDTVEQNICDIEKISLQIKTQLLKYAFSGKLTNGDIETWSYKKLADILDYEQPTAYIVNSTKYSDEYKTPVLTAGKSFVLGYTNEENGVYNNLPCIIFDDFTTDSRYIDFPFKVKSSAMKILKPSEEVNLKYVYYFMSITNIDINTHKRFWISEYSQIYIPLPLIDEQNEIVDKIEAIFNSLKI